MGEARSEQAWAHTSSVLALLANLHRDSKKTRAFKPADFNPHMRKPKPISQNTGIGVLKQVFVRSQSEDR
jgi:hypothetical protein